MRDPANRDPRHPPINFAAQTRRPPPAPDDAEQLRAHPRGRLWQSLPPVLRRGPWRRHRGPGEP